SGHSIAAGLSSLSPSGAPVSAHAVRVLMSVSVSLASFRKPPYRGSANHGGIFLLRTASLIAFAHGRVLSYVRNDMGATSRGRWQTWQFLCSIGSTSLLKETAGPCIRTSIVRSGIILASFCIASLTIFGGKRERLGFARPEYCALNSVCSNAPGSSMDNRNRNRQYGNHQCGQASDSEEDRTPVPG